MKQTIEIEVPEGKKAIWKDNKVIFEDVKSQLPKTWEEFCKIKNLDDSEAYIDNCSECVKLKGVSGTLRRLYLDQNVLPSMQAAEAHLALMQLHQLRDCYRQGWKPDLTIPESIFAIFCTKGKYSVEEFIYSSEFLSFQSKKIAQEFLNNFRDLIEQAGDLI